MSKGKYFVLRCPCPDKHQKTVRLTPSGASYVQNLLGQLRRGTCWKVEP